MSCSRHASSRKAEDLTADAAFNKILRLVTVSEQSTAKLVARLEREGYPFEAVESAISRAKSYGYVDDMRYADSFVRSRFSSGYGSLGIEQELSELGIDAYEVESYLEHVANGEDAELERAVRYLERKPPRSKNQREGAFRKLVQHGYSVSVASKAAGQWAYSD